MDNVFEKYSSNTLSANGNQTFIVDNKPEGIGIGMIFIKVFRGGTFNYRFVFSGIIDGTFSDGEISKCNDHCDWTIENLAVKVSNNCIPEESGFSQLFFDGEESIYVGNKKYQQTDVVSITAEKTVIFVLGSNFQEREFPVTRKASFRYLGKKIKSGYYVRKFQFRYIRGLNMNR